MENLNESIYKSDINLAAQTTKEIAQELQKKNGAELRKNGTSKLKKELTVEGLADAINKSSQYFQRPVSIIGGLFYGNYFIAQLVFEAKTAGEQSQPAIVSLQKKGKTWELDGLQLPK